MFRLSVTTQDGTQTIQYRLGGIIVFSSASCGVISTHIYGEFWPVLPFTIAIGAIISCLASRRYDPSPAWLFVGCGLLLAHTSILFLYPETMSVIDPDTYAVYTNQVVNSGDVTQAETRTYSLLPVFLILVSTASEVTGLAPRDAFVSIPILVSIIIPLVAAWFTALLTGCRLIEWPAVPAALFSSVLTMTVVSGYKPIAMTVGYLLLLLAFVTSIRFFLRPNKSDVITFVVLGIGVTISHRFTVLLLALGGCRSGRSTNSCEVSGPHSG